MLLLISIFTIVEGYLACAAVLSLAQCWISPTQDSPLKSENVSHSADNHVGEMENEVEFHYFRIQTRISRLTRAHNPVSLSFHLKHVLKLQDNNEISEGASGHREMVLVTSTFHNRKFPSGLFHFVHVPAG